MNSSQLNNHRRGNGYQYWIALLVMAILTGAACVWSFIRIVDSRESKISLSNFQSIEVGMDEAIVTKILGHPDRRKMRLGYVRDDGTFGTNAHVAPAKLRSQGYKNYEQLQWTSPEITIVVVINSHGSVATSYSKNGQSIDPLSRFVRAVIPPKKQ